MAYTSETRPAGSALLNGFSATVEALKAARAKRKVFNRTVDELSSLSNAELADIGLSRSVIRAVAREAANNN